MSGSKRQDDRGAREHLGGTEQEDRSRPVTLPAARRPQAGKEEPLRLARVEQAQASANAVVKAIVPVEYTVSTRPA